MDLSPKAAIDHLDGDRNEIALTFDDGPNDPHTLRLLEILAKHDATATFFLIGKHVRLRPDIVREIFRAGHAIGNHSETHPNLSFLASQNGIASVEKELGACRKAIEDAIGTSGALFRAPFGIVSFQVLRVAERMGFKTFGWSAEGNHWDVPPPAPRAIVDRIITFIGLNERGKIVLLHDGSPDFGTERTNSIEAADRLLKKYSKKRFVGLK